MFQKGDRVKVKTYGEVGGWSIGTTGILEREWIYRGMKCWFILKDGTNDCSLYNWEGDLELLSSDKKSIMNTLKQKFNNLFTKEPQKSFRKLGITDDSDVLTEDGKVVFLSWLLKQNQDQFKTDVVDPILAEEENDK